VIGCDAARASEQDGTRRYLGQGWIREVLDGVRSGVVLFELEDPSDDASLRFVYANPAAANLTKQPELKELVGQRASVAFPSASPERLHTYAEVCRTGVGRDIGRVIDGRSTGFHVHALPADARSVAVIFDPITEGDGAGVPLSQFMSEVLEHVPTMVFMKEATELRFEYFNKAGEELLGVARAALMGKNDHDFFPKEQADFFVAKDRKVLERGTAAGSTPGRFRFSTRSASRGICSVFRWTSPSKSSPGTSFKSNFARHRRWKRWDGSPAASRTISTICSV
jgi:PAS domain-containing protein